MSEDHRLLEHVLAGQRDLQESQGELQASCARIEERLDQALPALVARQERDAERLARLEQRVGATEKRLVVIGTTCTVVGTIAGVLWKVLGG